MRALVLVPVLNQDMKIRVYDGLLVTPFNLERHAANAVPVVDLGCKSSSTVGFKGERDAVTAHLIFSEKSLILGISGSSMGCVWRNIQ